MNILISTHDFSIGGAQIFVIRLATALSKLENVNVFLYDINPSMRNEKLLLSLPANVQIITYNYVIPFYVKFVIAKIHRLLYKFKIYKSFNKVAPLAINKFLQRHHFKAQLKKYKIHLINTHLWASDYFVANAIQKSNAPFVVSMHGCYEALLYGSYDAHMQSEEPHIKFIRESTEVLQAASAIIYVANKNLSIYNFFPNADKIQKPIKIYYGFESNNLQYKSKSELSFENDSIVFGIASRAIADKGWQQAIEAFISVSEQTSRKMYLILIGESEYMYSLKQQYVTYSSIHFIGFSSNPVEWIQIFDVGMLPTYFPGESPPNSIIEYLYCSKPVIATKVGEIPDMIASNSGNAGVLIDLDPDTKKADKQQLIDAMMLYVNNPSLLTQHTLLAKQAFQKFNMDICIKKYIEVFDRAMYGNKSK